MATCLPDMYLMARNARPAAVRSMAMSCGDSCLIAAWHRANRQGEGVRAILKSLGKALIVCAATASVISMAAAPALAAATWTVKPGGSVTGTATAATVTDSTIPLSLTCTSSTAKGSLKSGSGLPGAGIGTVTSFAFSSCTAGASATVTVTGASLNAISYSGVTKVAKMTITKFHGTFTVSILPGCSATVDGTSATAHNGLVKATFSDKTGALKVLAAGGNLHLYNPTSGCGNTFKSGDAVNFTASYKLSPKQAITSP
jgi:hypothetical protein